MQRPGAAVGVGQVHAFAQARHHLAHQRPHALGQLGRVDTGHQPVELLARGGEPVDEVPPPAALLHHLPHPVAVEAHRHRRLGREPPLEHLVGLPQHVHEPHRRRERIGLARGRAAAVRDPPRRLEHHDLAARDGRGRADRVVLRGEALQVPARDGPHGQTVARRPARDDECRPGPVGGVGVVAHQVPRLAELGEDAQAGGLADFEAAREFRQAEPLARVLHQEIEHAHHAPGGGRAPLTARGPDAGGLVGPGGSGVGHRNLLLTLAVRRCHDRYVMDTGSVHICTTTPAGPASGSRPRRAPPHPHEETT